jgi:hypothetical protein
MADFQIGTGLDYDCVGDWATAYWKEPAGVYNLYLNGEVVEKSSKTIGSYYGHTFDISIIGKPDSRWNLATYTITMSQFEHNVYLGSLTLLDNTIYSGITKQDLTILAGLAGASIFGERAKGCQ